MKGALGAVLALTLAAMGGGGGDVRVQDSPGPREPVRYRTTYHSTVSYPTRPTSPGTRQRKARKRARRVSRG